MGSNGPNLQKKEQTKAVEQVNPLKRNEESMVYSTNLFQILQQYNKLTFYNPFEVGSEGLDSVMYKSMLFKVPSPLLMVPFAVFVY